MFRDDYTNFSFRDQDSSNFKVWITNKNDLKRNMSPNFSDKFNAPTYGNIRYYEGTTIDKQDFKFSCAAVDITLNEWGAITEWLSPQKNGKLRFDWNDKYFYNVKVSKAPSGTMFVKGRIDSAMGQLYIVTFDLEFTTIGDWAALSDHGEQNFFWSDSDNQVVVNDIDPSIINNSYYTPSILCKKSETATVEPGSIIWSCDRLEISCLEAHASSEPCGYIYSIESPGINPVGWFIYDQDGLREYRRYYSSYDGSSLSYADVSSDLPLDSWSAVTSIEAGNYAIFNQDSNIYCTYYNTNKVLLNNFGSLDSYPNFYTKGEAEIVLNGTTWYKYSTNFTGYIFVNSNYATITSGGQLIELIRDDKHAPMFDLTKITNKGRMIIESGRPEMFKAHLNSYTYDRTITELTFLINNAPIYDRYKDCIVHLFNQDLVRNTNSYNRDKYGNKNYSSIYKDSEHVLLTSPRIRYEKTKLGWKLILTFNNNSILSDYTTKTFTDVDEHKNFYITLVDTNECQIKNCKEYSIGLQHRGVL